MRAYLIDDEPLALRRLQRLIEEDGRITIAGSSSDPATALLEVAEIAPDVLFLDIQMPEMDGFALLSRLRAPYLTIFTTAYDRYALKAFEVNSVDYLLKPVEAPQLARAIQKLERLHAGATPRPDLSALLQQMSAALENQRSGGLDRIASRTGDRVTFLELTRISHFFAEDKLTFAATAEKNWVIDRTITELEQRLDPARFARVHRSTVVNLRFVDELYPWFGGRMMLRLKDAKKTEITVSRDRLRELKSRLGL
ncbi:MAG: LytTR family DNA-binding domain-containing protein [Bryobacteraceae bacterium]|nr:response regulator transcription factor [Solibacteraceae bacterium]MCO5353743.1 LytTR family DNA-binding domain-containing protein [Bryobacteraceae bacterium]